jgi:serine/threonine protein kinase
MEHKIFLQKYRVAADEIALAATEPPSVGMAAAAEEVTTARTYRGQEIDSGREVAIEVVRVGAFKPSVREKLEEEAAAAKKINHANIPALYDFGIENDRLIYVSEYFEGTTAEEWVNEHGPMPTGAVLRIGLQVMSAMGAGAFHKISHHAINPTNVILVPGQTPEGDWPLIKVLHFIGVAPTFTGGDMAVAAFDKSTHYASPEQLRGGTVDFRSEIYSLGATMWFLLTAAPPLMAPKGPLAMQPTTSGLAVDKLSGMPKRLKRLLVQMLSVDPDARPQDPLAFYRQIQNSIVQVDRRESMARRFGVPLASRSNVGHVPSRRRFPAKTLALAAILVALVTLGSMLAANYLRHERIRQAEEPIGVPIGVTEAHASAAPVTANAPTVAPAPSQPTAVAQTTAAPSIKPLPETESTPAVAANSPAPAPAESEAPAPAPPANNPPAEAPKIVQKQNAPSQPSEPAVTKTREEKPATSSTEVAEAVPTARPISPEVRRAEPPSPAEGPEETAPPSVEKKVVTKPKRERATKLKRPDEEAAPRAELADEETQTAPMPQLPRGRTRARFIGVTADGNWMFSLPNKKIVVVPPPPGG